LTLIILLGPAARLSRTLAEVDVPKSGGLEAIGDGVDDDHERVLGGPTAHLRLLDVLDPQATGVGQVLDRHGSSSCGSTQSVHRVHLLAVDDGRLAPAGPSCNRPNGLVRQVWFTGLS
jgi:hypothetical protein